MLGGSGCQGKRSCQENREERRRRRGRAQNARPIREQSVPPRPVQWSGTDLLPATHGRQMGMARDCWVHFVCLTGIIIGLGFFDRQWRQI